jgi:hypothetical protein
MSVRVAVTMCLCVAFDIDASELYESARGLRVNIEEMEGAVAVNGLPISIMRATGADVLPLAKRIVDQWRIESGAESVRVTQCCGWNVASRLHAGASHAIQWRSSSGGELLESTADLGAAARIVPTPRLPLITDCAWSTPVHGRVAQRQFLQISGRCTLEPSRALDLTARSLADAGWHWKRSGPLVLQAERGTVQAQVTAGPATRVLPEPATGRSSLVLVESQPAEGSQR